MSGREVWLLGTSFYRMNIPAIAQYVYRCNRHRCPRGDYSRKQRAVAHSESAETWPKTVNSFDYNIGSVPG
jgi:hypothetical protein